MATVKQIYDYINTFAPFDSQLSWDNSGLLVGDMQRQVTVAAVALDATVDNIKAAADCGAQLLITHHPIIFGSINSVLANSAVYTAVSAGLSVISVHTPWDLSSLGVNTVLAHRLGLADIRVLETQQGGAMSRIGRLPAPMTEEQFAELVKNAVGIGCVKYNKVGHVIETVALCGGSAAEFAQEASAAGADAFVTADVRHHFFLNAAEIGITLVDAGHYNTENLSMSVLSDLIKDEFSGLQVKLLKTDDPVSYI